MQHRARGSQSESPRTRVDGASNGSAPTSVIGSWVRQGGPWGSFPVQRRHELRTYGVLGSLSSASKAQVTAKIAHLSDTLAPPYGSMLRMLLIKVRRESSLPTLLTPPHLQGRRLSY